MTGRRLRSKRQQPTASEVEPQPAPQRAKRRKATTSTRSRQVTVDEPESDNESESVEDVEDDDDDKDESHGSADVEAQIERQMQLYPNVPKIATSKKNAPKPRKPSSMVSVTVHRIEEMDDSYAEHGALHESNSQEEPDAATRQRIMVLNLPDLVKAAQELIGLHDMHNHQTSMFQLLMPTRRRVFRAVVEDFCPPGRPDDLPVFIDANMLDDVDISAVQENLKQLGAFTAAQAIGYANLAIAIEVILWFDLKNFDLWLSRIALLDTSLHEVLAPFGDEAASIEVALSLRTLHALRILPKIPKDKATILKVFTSVFCQQTADKRDLIELLNRGPYKAISHKADEDVDELCSEHAFGTFSYIVKNKGSMSQKLEVMRSKTYELNEVLNQVAQWLLTAFHVAKDQQKPRGHQTRQTEDPDSQVNAPPDVPDSYPADLPAMDDDASNTESQPIVRLSGAPRGSLFSGEPTVFQAMQASNSRTSLPSSRQDRPMRSVSETEEMENADILGPPPRSVSESSPARSGVIVPTHAIPRSSKGKERAEPVRAIPEDDDDDDDDDSLGHDPFEEDTRPRDKQREIAVFNLMKENRRDAAAPASAQAPPPTSSGPSSSMHAHHPPRYVSPGPEASPALSSSAAAAPFIRDPPPSSYVAALREEKRLVSQKVRQQLPPSIPRQRHAWSDKDSETLVDLIRTHHAAWSIIEGKENDQFEHPRNQQAYRDRARNMKVDMLLTDAVLPPCFDLVTLGKKEIKKVQDHGKNPNRREHDVDEYGRAINTEL